MSIASFNSIFGHLSKKVAWKIASIAIGPVVGLALSLVVSKTSETTRQNTESEYRLAREVSGLANQINADLAFTSSVISTYLSNRSGLADSEISRNLADTTAGISKLKTSAGPDLLQDVVKLDDQTQKVLTSFGKLRERVESVGRTSAEGLTDDLDKMTEMLAALFDGAASMHDGFRALAAGYADLRGTELRYRWKRDPKLEPRIEFMRADLVERLSRAEFDKAQAEMLLDSLNKQTATFKAWRAGLDAERRQHDQALEDVKQAMSTIAALRDRSEARQTQAQASSADAEAMAARLTLGAAALAALASVAMILIVGRSLGAALSRLALAMRRVADGEPNVEIPYAGRRDEIGDMSNALHVFQASIVERADLAQKAEATAQERVARAQRVERSVSAFGSSIEVALQQLQGSAEKMRQASQTLDSDARALTAQAEIAGNATAMAAREVSSVAVATEQMTESIDEVSHQAMRSSEVADRAVQRSQRATAMMLELAGEASKIGDVVELIRSIAGQTNLLALNATIEAARAGEAGKGFAVVAAEVKALATQTAQATEDIVQKIAAIQGASGDVSEAIAQIGGILSEMRAIATSVASAVEEQSSAIATISSNVGVAAQSTTEGASAIRDAESRANSSRATSSEVAHAAQTVSSEASALEAVVSKFLDDVRAA